jgi:hypothetical protein
MTRELVVLLALGLVFAPAASAKGPHALLTSGPEGVEVGRPWSATIEFNEFPRPPKPRMVATQGDRRVIARLRATPASMEGAAGFRVRLVLPTEGRWRITVVAAQRRFAFPALDVGSGLAPQDYMAFPKGSAAERQGAGGVITQGPVEDPGAPDTALPPEVITFAEPPSNDDGGFPLWIPGLGLALVGAGVGLGAAKRR